MQRKVASYPLTEQAEMFYTLTSVSSFNSSPSSLPANLIVFPVTPFSSANSPLSIFLPSYCPYPTCTLLCTDKIASLCPVIRFTLIFMERGEDEEDESGGGGDGLGVEEDNRAEMKEEKMREKRGQRTKRWGGGVR